MAVFDAGESVVLGKESRVECALAGGWLVDMETG